VRKGTKLLRLRALCEEAEAIPVSFESELRPLRAAVAAAEGWEAEHGALLQALRLADAGAGAGGEVGPAAAPEAAQPVSLEALRSAAASAAQLAADFDSARYVAALTPAFAHGRSHRQLQPGVSCLSCGCIRSAQELLVQVDRWSQRVDKMCGFATVKQEPAVAAAVEGGEGEQRPGKRRKSAHGAGEGGAAGDGLENDEDAATDGVDAMLPPALAVSAAAENSTGMVTVEQLQALVQQGRGFGVDLEGKVQLLLQLQARAEAWEKEAAAYFAGPFSEALKRVFVEYKRLITDYTASDNGAAFCFLANRKPSALTPGNQAKAAKEESTLGAKVQALLAEVLQVRAHCEAIGVATPYYRAMLAYVRLLEWVDEARSVSCWQVVSRRPAAWRAPASAKTRGLKTSFEGWEDLKEPLKLKNWGDVDEQLVLALVREGAEMLSHFYPLDQDDKVPGMLAHYAKGLLAPAAEFREQSDAAGTVSDEEGSQSGSDDGEEGEAGGDGAEAGDGQEQEGQVGSKRPPQHGDTSSARKRKQARTGSSGEAAASPSFASSGKSTRGAAGISKRRVDEDFAETVNLNQLGAAIQDKGAKGKRQRGSAAEGTANAVAAAVGAAPAAALAPSEPPVELDLARTAHREGLHEYLALCEQAPQQSVRFAPAMGYMVDLWQRVLKVYALRLRAAGRWVRDTRALLEAAGTAVVADADNGEDHVSTGAPAAGGGVPRAHAGEEAERLLAEAAQEGFQSKYRFARRCTLWLFCFLTCVIVVGMFLYGTRTLLEKTVQESKEWLRRAAEMRTSSSALLSMEDLKAFLKVTLVLSPRHLGS
jgi:hypothetical protein